MLLNHTSGFNNWDNWCGAEGQGVRNNGAGKFWVEPFSAYSFYSSVADMAQFISNAITTGHSMSHSFNKVTPGIPLTEFCSWGLGWGIEHGTNFETLWHWGNLGDYQCFMAISSELQDGIVILTNSGNAKPAFAELVEHYLGRSMACAQVGFIEMIVGHKFCP